ncbi:hypothetical protein LTR06_000174 [Exophiala xenobiotica]|nr:hypothetical protein LTR06_000174 [Exophiala xenobiotica]
MSDQTKGRSGGVLPVNAAARKNAAAQSGSKGSARLPAPRLRLIIRRLPPGLTETEFWIALGDDWKVGSGKVDWAAFKDGKISKDPAKPSRPARAYIKVKEQSLLDPLSATVKETTFQDAKNTTKDSCLLGPPSLEFAPYNKIPSGRNRNDARQGTIDQDQEFIDFLQGLTEPITKSTANGADSAEVKQEKASITPLVQYIKDKKANKAKEKEGNQAKATKAREKQETKPAMSESPRSTVVIKGKHAPAEEKQRVQKATEDAVKAINKSVAAMQGKHQQQAQTPAKGEPKKAAKEPSSPSPAQATPVKRGERQRGNVSAAARMLQRDLGLLSKENKSQRTAMASTSTATTELSTSSTSKPAPAPSVLKPQPVPEPKPASPAPTATPTGPRASRTPSVASTKTPSTPSQRQTKSAIQPSAGAKSAFLKHANPSQGITEELLQAAFKDFGAITRCEIDKKKGLGYIDFDDTDGLRKAMAASPVKVANGQVVVLENKSPYAKRGGGPAPGEKQAGASSSGAGAAKGAANVKTQTQGSGATSTASTPTPGQGRNGGSASSKAVEPTKKLASSGVIVAKDGNAVPTTPTTPAAATPPTAPAGTPRGGAGGNRGGRAGNGGGGGGGGGARGSARGAGQGGRQGQSHRGGRSAKRGGGGGATAAAEGGQGPAATTATAPATAPAAVKD